MAASTTKRVVITRFEREPVQGIVNPQHFLLAEGVEILSLSGTVSRIPFGDIKAVSFQRDGSGNETWKMNRLFSARPKLEGLWIRLRFRDGDLIDGVLPNNLLLLDPFGFTFIPPDPSFQNQRLFVPRPALTEIQVLGVVGSPITKGKAKPKPASREQLEMFEK